MLRISLLTFIAFLCSCNNGAKKDTEYPIVTTQASTDSANNEIRFKTRFHSFDTTVEVLFWDTIDSISNVQRENYDGFISKQDLLTPEILKSIFEFYKSSYLDYKKGWTIYGNISDKELEKHLPIPTNPEALKKFITPGIVHIQNKKDCEPGTIGIEFDCTWDIEHGVGVKIQNWKVIEAGLAETSYFFRDNKP